ncbi:peptidase s41 family protein [Gigaspora margarita]|uniref:Peptidase s41 family protein n=1 Tax=Gigaspora margarita TaxID=4874 RepID=A0A8H4B4P8_GIGMA|nr:peptidase s41 family protein [Gigaspora margarita]
MRVIILFALILTIYGTSSFAIPIESRNESKHSLDGCARIHESYKVSLSKNRTLHIKYNDVKDCYLSFPFDLNRATKVIESLKGIYHNFYIYLDQAKEKAHDGFDFRPVDLITELDALLKNNYTTDFEFFSNITQIIIDLKDSHTYFLPTCYSSFSFNQNILLYSSVNSKGIQSIKVFHDDLNPSNAGCEVTHINGSPALGVITDFAKNHVKNSRDLGVRFNMALASLQLINLNYSTINGNFASRSVLPETENITYDLKCSNTNNIKKLIRPWIISANSDSFYNNFNDSKSYHKSVCLIGNVTQSNPFKKRKILNLPIERLELADIKIPIIEKNVTYIGDFAMLLKIGDIGVVVISTFQPNLITNHSVLITELASKLDSFAKSGIVLDFTNNVGGYIEFSQYFNTLFFPQKRAAFPRDIKINNITTFLINQADKLNFKLADIDPKVTLSYTTDVPFKNADEYIGNNQYTRGGVTTRYSSLFNEIYSNSSLLNFTTSWKFPWSNKDVIILTNGACGSSCAQTTQYLAEQANFATVSVGGFFNYNMSYSSYPGGSVISVDDFYTNVHYIIAGNTTIGHPEIPIDLANNISMYSFQFSFSETYSLKFPNNVTEFMYRPATYRLYYDDKSIYNPRLLWLQAAKFIS